MKKLKLKNLKLQSKELLQRNELKTVFGGYGDYGGGGSSCHQPFEACFSPPYPFTDTCCGDSICVVEPGYSTLGKCSGYPA